MWIIVLVLFVIAFAIVISNIAALGQVQINGVEWTARSTTNSHIPAGTLVRVDRIEGVKVFVTAVEETAMV